jgi:hypothetical protein
MAFLSDSEILKLSDPSLCDQDILITRGKSNSTFKLLKAHNHGRPKNQPKKTFINFLP